ncbi:aldehyde dehydrogenase family protein [Kordiimonas sp. SCSIO 12610]|uniref:aldehyde dehydrogenase family protein n=1 Tax=Kordiimonas sp. SCSIO 12610 TaxID=2829597 RepID=UPI00210E7991|nr:aldehyde dehydrogenase family protein [Kordiimonas sp. SCSIO 12610]UTW54837.1 aldehyde dehydrogenase family protein [Kordiimonas sp. SCSIO 12610]
MSVAEKFASMDYAPAPESRAKADEWLSSHGGQLGLYINGEWIKPEGAAKIASYAPSTGEKLTDITVASQENVDLAIASARKAQAKWGALGGHGRARYLYALARLVQKHSRILAVLESLDNGKPIRESRDLDIPLVARHFYHHAGWAQLIDDEYADYEALGVAGQVIPWNFPLLMLAWKVAPALAAGNTVVLKPAEFTSLTSIKFAELCEEAGLPKGVLNIVTGDGDVGAMVVDGDVDKVAFTGSTDVGKLIRRSVAGTGKKLTLELGGKGPYIVFEDADIDGAIEGLVDAIWFNQGQVCCAGSRLLIQEGIADRFIEKLKARMSQLRVGDSLDKCIDVGALIDKVQKERIEGLIKTGVEEGASVWQAPCQLPGEGVFMAPTLVTDVGMENTLLREEIFGPVLTTITFRTQQEAVSLANNSRYGLAASVWSESVSRALEVAPALKAGVVWVNGANMFDAAVGFGGYRESGFGREGGHEGMLAYLKPKFEAKLKNATPIQMPEQLTMPKNTGGMPGVDQTAKHYMGGKQARPDGGDSREIWDHKGKYAGLVAEGNYKDIRNAVEAATAAGGWAATTSHLKAQILYYIAENLGYRFEEFSNKLQSLTGVSAKRANEEVELSIQRLFSAAAYADKFEGRVHEPPMRGVAIAMNEPLGVMGIACPDEAPLLGFVTLMSHAIAMGNSTIIIPSERYPSFATDFYQILETSDLPAGVVNIVTGGRDALAAPLAKHLGIDGLWYFGDQKGAAMVETHAAENMKRTWVSYGKAYDWFDTKTLASRFILEKAIEVKNIWVPYGDQNTKSGSY